MSSHQLSLFDTPVSVEQVLTKKWRSKQKFYIKLEGCLYGIDNGYVSDTGRWGIHQRGDKGWALTHLPTARLVSSFDKLKQAKVMAEKLERQTGVQWDEVKDQIEDSAIIREVRKLRRDCFYT